MIEIKKIAQQYGILCLVIMLISGCATQNSENVNDRNQYNKSSYNDNIVMKRFDELICASDEKNKMICTDKKFKLYNGIAYDNYDNGNIFRKISFINGVYDGKASIFEKDGTLWGEFNYKNGVPDGVDKIYYANGNVFMEFLYAQSKLKFGKMYYPGGQLLSLATEDYEKWYYENGQLRYEHALKDWDRRGAIKIYYDTGELKAIVNLDDETTKIYHKNGYLKMDIGKSKDVCFDDQGNKIHCTIENIKADLDDLSQIMHKTNKKFIPQEMMDD